MSDDRIDILVLFGCAATAIFMAFVIALSVHFFIDRNFNTSIKPEEAIHAQTSPE